MISFVTDYLSSIGYMPNGYLQLHEARKHNWKRKKPSLCKIHQCLLFPCYSDEIAHDVNKAIKISSCAQTKSEVHCQGHSQSQNKYIQILVTTIYFFSNTTSRGFWYFMKSKY